MYKTERGQGVRRLQLNDFAKQNLARLINHPETSHIILSAEGEPFNNEPAMEDIQMLSRGKRNYFQIITNGAWPQSQIRPRIKTLSRRAQKTGCDYSLRISLDSHHLEKVDKRNYAAFFEVFSGDKGATKGLSLAIRSLMEDRDLTRRTIFGLLEEKKIEYEAFTSSPLDEEIKFRNGNMVNVNYKNLVNPGVCNRTSNFPLEDYVAALEQKYGKTFTLGNLAAKRAEKGLDITIKPTGDVLFYGIEVENFGNIFKDEIDIDYFKRIVERNPLVNALYAAPFMHMINELSANPEIKRKIAKINNPYWVIKTLYPKYKPQIEEALKIK
jgi:hypothetical protein